MTREHTISPPSFLPPSKTTPASTPQTQTVNTAFKKKYAPTAAITHGARVASHPR